MRVVGDDEAEADRLLQRLRLLPRIGLEPRLQAGIDGEVDAHRIRLRGMQALGRMGDGHAACRGAPGGTASRFARSGLPGVEDAEFGHAGEHAVAGGRGRARESGPAGSAPAIAAARPEAPPPRPSAAAAPCRTASGSPPARLRYCRHRARAEDRGRGFPPWTGVAPARSPSASARPSPQSSRVGSDFRIRATCMVSVEPPETIWPLDTDWKAARSRASPSMPPCSAKRLSSQASSIVRKRGSTRRRRRIEPPAPVGHGKRPQKRPVARHHLHADLRRMEGGEPPRYRRLEGRVAPEHRYEEKEKPQESRLGRAAQRGHVSSAPVLPERGSGHAPCDPLPPPRGSADRSSG